MSNDTAYARARKRAKAKLGFFNHAIVYAVVIGFLFIVNFVTSSEYLWAFWPAIGWGIALAIHGATVYLKTDEAEMLDRMTERELEREKARHQN